jgi:hypothetical protein
VVPEATSRVTQVAAIAGQNVASSTTPFMRNAYFYFIDSVQIQAFITFTSYTSVTGVIL